jgi:hypothetical protein
VLVMTPSQDTIRVVQDCADRVIRRVGCTGLEGKELGARRRSISAGKNGTQLVEGYCPFMFLPAAAFMHQAHGLLMKLTRRYPARAA